MYETSDASYKLIWQGYPVLIAGTTDCNYVFHSFCLAVCKGETTEDFEFVFRTLHQFDPEWNPNVLLADGSEAITAGFEREFGPSTPRLMCYFHMLQNIKPYLKVLTKEGVCGHIKVDLNALQISADETTFRVASALFIAKWKKKAKKDRRILDFLQYFESQRILDFLQYFEAQWIQKNFNWYKGASPTPFH